MSQASITVDASCSLGPLPYFSTFFGCDEPNYATYPQGSALMKEIGALGNGHTYFRTHNLLTTGDESQGLVGVPGLKFGSTNAYSEDADGNPTYNWTIVDGIFDSYRDANVRPYVEIGFMPEALASNPEPYFFKFDPAAGPGTIYTGWSHPPTSYEKWEELVYQWVDHTVSRYGADEVNQWWFETWNEPNIAYWNGTREEFYKLHDHAVNGVRRALPTARVGGADVAGGIGGDNFLGEFLDHCLNGTNYATGQQGTPLDFVSWHAKGAPTYINETDAQYLQINVSTQLNQINDAFALVAQYPQLDGIPIVLGEFDPDGCAACTSAAYGYRNSLFYPAYVSESYIRALDLAASNGVNLQGALTWAFEYEPTKSNPNETAYYDGYRVLSTQGIDKAVLNVHRMLAMLEGGCRISANSSAQLPIEDVLTKGIRQDPDVGVLASTSESGEEVYVFVWHYHDNDLDFPDANVSITVSNLPDSCWNQDGQYNITQYRLDNDNGNAYPLWQQMGSPQPPSDDQIQQLQDAALLKPIQVDDAQIGGDGSVQLEFSLPIRACSLHILAKKY